MGSTRTLAGEIIIAWPLWKKLSESARIIMICGLESPSAAIAVSSENAHIGE